MFLHPFSLSTCFVSFRFVSSRLDLSIFFCFTFAAPCGVGYTRQYLSLKKFLATQPFANDIQIVGIKDPGVTGNFEVTVGDDRELVHSKRTAGQGKAESEQEREMIVEFIQEYLDGM